MQEILEHLVSTGPEWASRRASLALDITGQYQAGEITESEYKELMMDLVNADQLDSEATDLDTKTALVTAVYAVAQVI